MGEVRSRPPAMRLARSSSIIACHHPAKVLPRPYKPRETADATRKGDGSCVLGTCTVYKWLGYLYTWFAPLKYCKTHAPILGRRSRIVQSLHPPRSPLNIHRALTSGLWRRRRCARHEPGPDGAARASSLGSTADGADEFKSKLLRITENR